MTGLALVLVLLAPDPVGEQVAILRKHEKLPYDQGERLGAIYRLGRIGTPASTRALEALLEDPFGHVQDAAVSALIALKRRSEEQRDRPLGMLADFLRRRKKPQTRIHLATALGLIGDVRAVDGLLDALKPEKDAGAVEAIAIALARLKHARAFAGLRAKLDRGPGRAACMRALSGFVGAGEVAQACRDDQEDAVKAAVVDVLAARQREILPGLEAVVESVGVHFGIALAEALPAVRDPALARRRAAALLKHGSWRVRAAAVGGVERMRDPALLGDLVELLARETGRLRSDAWTALRRLTGKQIGPDPAQWRAILPLAALPGKGVGAGEAPEGTVAYFTLPVYSERIAFVFDVSGSMRDEDKIGRAREQFRATAAKLRPSQRYDLFVYRFLLVYPPRPRLERAFGKLVSGKARAACAWLRKQQAKGGGALYDALALAMADDEVDTIYLLSDGVPSYGTVSRGWRVVQEIRRRNRWRRVVIHGVMLDRSPKGLDFMKELARATGGTAVDANGQRLG